MDSSSHKESWPLIHNVSTSDNDKKPLEFTTPERRIISWLPAIVLGIGVLILLGVLLNKYTNSSIETTASTAQVSSESAKFQPISQVFFNIDVEGAVNQPGVYEIPNDSRIQDVLISAGGLVPNADRKYVARYINLSAKVSDTMKLYIPFEGEVTQPSSEVLGTATGLITETINANSQININDASQSQLESLTGVGPVTAKKIISGRPYQNITELTSRKIISKSLFEKIKEHLNTN